MNLTLCIVTTFRYTALCWWLREITKSIEVCGDRNEHTVLMSMLCVEPAGKDVTDAHLGLWAAAVSAPAAAAWRRCTWTRPSPPTSEGRRSACRLTAGYTCNTAARQHTWRILCLYRYTVLEDVLEDSYKYLKFLLSYIPPLLVYLF